MKNAICIVVVVIVGVVLLSISFSQHKEFLKDNAAEKWAKQGFETIDYEGWQIGLPGILGMKYGGARVWHRLRKIPDNGITYSGYLMRWGNEIHVYGPKATEAISPK